MQCYVVRFEDSMGAFNRGRATLGYGGDVCCRGLGKTVIEKRVKKNKFDGFEGMSEKQ